MVGFNGFQNCVPSQIFTGSPMERAETHSSVPYVHAPALQRAVKTLIFVDFEKNGKIRPGTAPVEPLNGIIGVTLYGVS